MKNGHERVGYASGYDNKPNQVDAESESSVTCREYPDVEEKDGTFGQCYGEAVEDQPGHEALEVSSTI